MGRTEGQFRLIECVIQLLMGQSCRPLHGIPILIKNNIATDDKMTNTAGSYALIGAKVPEDSTMAAKLRKAGAIILGKTNLVGLMRNEQRTALTDLDSHNGPISEAQIRVTAGLPTAVKHSV